MIAIEFGKPTTEEMFDEEPQGEGPSLEIMKKALTWAESDGSELPTEFIAGVDFGFGVPSIYITRKGVK